MRLAICSIGRLKTGPERVLFERYIDRTRKIARAFGVAYIDLHEIAESRAARPADRRADEAGQILSSLPSGGRLIALDERGDAISSHDFAHIIRTAADRGDPALMFAIGGPDGHGDSLRQRADRTIAFGAATFPHQIVRILLAEQIYRAATILTGHPYHRA